MLDNPELYALLTRVYLAILDVLEIGLDAVLYLIAQTPMHWPEWARIGVPLVALYMIFNVLFSGGWRIKEMRRTVLGWILSAPLTLLRRLILLVSAPFGKSRWGKRREMRKEDMFKPSGLFLGQIGALWLYRFEWSFLKPPEWLERFLRLIRVQRDLHHHGEGHFITVAAPGGGKTTSALIPPLLTARNGSFIVTDPKGEITAITRRFRETQGQVFYLNPFHEDFSRGTGLEYPDSGFNPLCMIENSENTRAQADIFARFLMVTDRQDSNSYFKDEGAELLSLFITWMVRHEPPENQFLTYLYELVRRDVAQILEFMISVDDPQVTLEAERFLEMREHAPAQWTGAISKAHLATKRYIPGTPLGRHVEQDGFDPLILKREDVTVYILLPTQHVKTGAPWLNMVIGLLGDAVGRPGRARPVYMLLDELPALGFLPDLRSQMRQFRGSGLRMWLFTQTTAALTSSDMYGPEGTEDLFGLCDTKQFFSIREVRTAREVSAICGETSRMNRSQSTRDETDSVSVVGTPLIRPEEILRLPKNKQIIIRKGIPIMAALVPYFRRKAWRKITDDNPYRE